MLLFNIILSRELGGIQQAYIDYGNALQIEGYEVINISSIYSKINDLFRPHHKLPNLGRLCIISKLYMLLLCLYYRPKIIICHGGQAVYSASFANFLGIKLLGIGHTYNFNYLKKCHYVIALTKQFYQFLIEMGFDKNKLFICPNMIKSSYSYVARTISIKPEIVVGAMGRFFDNKGFKYLVRALAILRKQELNVKLVLGGDGPNKKKLLQEAYNNKISDHINFLGWCSEKEQFFNNIDIFCIPSLSESFGIIILEAFSYSVPVIASSVGGPKEIVKHQYNGLLAETRSADGLANAIKMLIKTEGLAEKLSKNGFDDLQKKYEFSVVSKKLSNIISSIAKK
jgi:glycosyltransferase involved in cell wall biosynthesis